MINATLCLPVKKGKILLGMKKIGFGKNKLNAFGGKVEIGESIKEAAKRELYEEVGLITELSDLKKVAELKFTFPANPDWDQIVHVFKVESWKNDPKESDEMGFEWFNILDIPFDKMWDDDKYWLPLILSGKKIKANFSFADNNETIKNKQIIEV